MEGHLFRQRRLLIEAVFEKIEQLLVKKDPQKAEKALKNSQSMLSELSEEVDRNEIQERSIDNMTIKWEVLAKQISKISNH